MNKLYSTFNKIMTNSKPYTIWSVSELVKEINKTLPTQSKINAYHLQYIIVYGRQWIKYTNQGNKGVSYIFIPRTKRGKSK